MLFKVIRKLKLGSAARAVLLPMVKAAGTAPLSLTAEKAETLLSAHSPDPRGSAYLAERPEQAAYEYDLDIIVPVYNVEAYLPACIHSVLSQETDFRFRVIFVDDGAADNSGRLLDACKDDPRVLVIHQKNKGLSGARNTGIEAASSRYLLFLDSDDLLAPGAVQALLSAAEMHSAALVQGCFATFRDGGKPSRELSFEKSLVVDPPLSSLPGYAWGKLIRSDYFRNLRFPEGYWFEDSVNAQILFPLMTRNQETIVAINDIVCHYRVNPQGISSVARKRPKAIDSFWLTRQLHQDRRHFSLEISQYDYEYILDMIRLTYERTERQPREIQEALLVLWNAFLMESFSGFRTSRRAYEALEAAVKNKNFTQYSLCCRLL